jgi:hypothetical protein
MNRHNGFVGLKYKRSWHLISKKLWSLNEMGGLPVNRTLLFVRKHGRIQLAPRFMPPKLVPEIHNHRID